MPILQRTIKLVLATSIGIFLASLWGLSNPTSAGIIAILSILDTRRSSFKIAKQRLLSTLLALLIGAIVFFLLDFSIISLGVYLLIYVPLAYTFKLESGIAPSTVLVTHLLIAEKITLSLLLNEFSLFLIGAGVALIFNLYMPSRQKQINDYHIKVEDLLKKIFLKFDSFLKTGDGRNDAELINQLDSLLKEALAVVYLDRRNQLFNQTNYQVHYFEMRKAQLKILREMAKRINHFQYKSAESYLLSQLFVEVSAQLSEKNSAKGLLSDIEAFLESFRKRDLPKTRYEFETRAILFQLLYDVERIIQLKVDFYHDYHTD
ncbi:aromatic acid exporter family protein [Streptococcus pacificus]|uniref:Aromatic acid exporter family protein n=1 Tax=Streptococcus pacificus TaxID=2740577 RepID=A0ABS0ZHX1_9STRE|nr:aromatic acid exporter family protein [Streptococcus pacificus]MBJ8325599.1 aromatic acid exporter family protein [Streptococcus pacificus]